MSRDYIPSRHEYWTTLPMNVRFGNASQLAVKKSFQNTNQPLTTDNVNLMNSGSNVIEDLDIISEDNLVL